MKREIEDALLLMLKSSRNNVILVEGARQVGKSYLVEKVLQKQARPFVSFDLEKHKKIKHQIDETRDFNDFCALMFDQYKLRKGSVLFIDEAQESSMLAGYIKSFKEDWPDIRVILTGMRIPVGRTESLRVLPFSFSEFLEYTEGLELADFVRSAPSEVPVSRHKYLLSLYNTYIKTGGYPEAVIAFNENTSFTNVQSEILYTLEEDFQRKEEFQPALFRNALNAVANHIGSVSKLTQFETTKYHAERIINAMKSWHIILEVEPHSFDPHRSHFLPKRYLHDLGIVNLRRTLSVPDISILETVDPVLRTPLGGIFENGVLLSLIQGEHSGYSIGAWKKGGSGDIEVDFVMNAVEGRVKVPIECKAAMKVKKKHFKNLIHYLRLSNQKYGILVSAAPFAKIEVEDKVILNVPIYLSFKSNLINYIEMY
jgi:uncharacterized protein